MSTDARSGPLAVSASVSTIWRFIVVIAGIPSRTPCGYSGAMRGIRGTGGLIGKSFSLIFWALALLIGGVVAAVSAAFDAAPVLTAIGGALALALVVQTVREVRKQKAAAVAERLRDEHVPSMSPTEYEQFAARQLERAGWAVKHCGRTGDQGADVIAELRGFKAVCQVKLYRSRCGNQAVQEAVGARKHYGAQIMVVVAPSGFTRSAVELAASNGVHLLHHTALVGLERAARIP